MKTRERESIWESTDRAVSLRRSGVIWKEDKEMRVGTARGPEFGQIARVLSVMVAMFVLGFSRGSLASGLPVPSFVYYGEITDAFGWPFLGSDNAQVVALRMDGRECGRAPVHEAIGPTINYRVEVAMAEPRGAAYAAYAVREGERITMVLEAGGTRYPVTRPGTVPAVGRPGSLLRQDLALGNDLDGDGLPDEWEEWLIQESSGLLTTSLDVRPGDDFDGDGVTNREEYLAGTDPAWDEDLPLIEAVHYGPSQGQVAVAVLTVPGRTYRILGASILSANASETAWSPQKIGLSATVDPQDDYWRGDGQLTWVYLRVGVTGPSFLKLEVR
ncbi:MAG: hypothetical protein IT581_06370 [Verrucomicrobiales bacterium]|nr:hypothetical protein [Verrucomicrobiales bacterium]